MRRLLLLVILLFFNYAKADFEQDPLRLAQRIIDRFDEMAAPSKDLTERLRIIKETGANFVKLPLGALVSSDTVGKPESDEYKALMKLSHHMKDQLDHLNERISYKFEAEEMHNEKREFQNTVTITLNVFSKDVLHFLDPTIRITPKTMEYSRKYECSGEGSVEKKAEYIKSAVMEECELNNTLVFVKVEELLHRLEQKFGIREWNNNEKYQKRRILRILNSNPSHIVIPELEIIEAGLDVFPTFTKALEGIYESIEHMQKLYPKRCLTDSVIDGNWYNRTKISLYTSLIQTELARLMLYVNICGKFSFPNDTAKYGEYLQNVGSNITETAAFLVDYIPRKLNLSSSDIQRLIARKVVEDFDEGKGNIPHDKFSELGHRIKEAVESVGPERIEKQLIVAPSENSDPHFSAFYACPTYWCTTILNTRGVDVMIARFDKDQASHAGSIEKRRDDIQSSIVDLLQNDYYFSLPHFVEELESEKNVTLMDKWAKSAAIIRHKTLSPVVCEYPTILQEYQEENTNMPTAAAHFRYNNFLDRAWFDDNTCYHFFFFL